MVIGPNGRQRKLIPYYAVQCLVVDLRLQQVSIKFSEVPFHKCRDRMLNEGGAAGGVMIGRENLST
jgi:hypothetical protein